MPYIPSASELSERGGGEFTLLPEDQYLVEVVGGTIGEKTYPRVENQPNPYNRTEQFPDGEPRPVLRVALRAISFSNRDPLVDVNGEAVTDERHFFAFLDTTKVGMVPQPSAFRKFIAAALGQPVGDGINIGEWEELVGKRLNVSVRHKNGYARPYDYFPVRGNRQPAAEASDTADTGTAGEAPAAMSDEELKAKANEVFGDDTVAF